ncbi:GNAT family N-acetyltransferase [Geodermatophilus sp. TF02-6]|uniref:GNAT family N-acetyltransferase n=1 Tax=Geodermatophilus sp. TF02-6 TaxID=2250575 RepID=UPI000DEA1602|nr:GNAT family N-acetyltransferase [Geodermatophilus sp. TF02-6]RBY77605.1 GNAT family N-acetyltransferase [Geodermatophilus sp. TF02-6]
MTVDAGRVGPLGPADVDAAVAVLAASHADYPAFRHVWPRPQVRARALRPFLRASVADAAALSASTVGRDRDGVLAVALWLPPGAFPWSTARKLRAAPALLRTALAAPRSAPAFARIGSSAERTHPGEPSWYLETLGVHPRAQRQGWGQRVLRPGLERADREGRACYVETSDPANERFYRSLGFEVVAPRLEHLPGGPPYLGLRRPPGG